MYCKNCGRQLKEGLRFCDRCGQSVRKNGQTTRNTKREEIEELKAERLNRKRRLQEKEKKQALNKKRRKKKSKLFLFFVVAILIAIVSFIVGYEVFDGGGNDDSAIPSSSPIAASTEPSPSQQADKNGYVKMAISGVTCIYPSSFNSNTVTGNEKLNLTDALGGANMVVTQEGKSSSVTDLMKDYAAQMGGEVTYSRAGDDWYAVTVSVADMIYHRKCVLRNGIAVYYDFSYMATTSTAQKYADYINDIDNSFK